MIFDRYQRTVFILKLNLNFKSDVLEIDKLQFSTDSLEASSVHIEHHVEVAHFIVTSRSYTSSRVSVTYILTSGM